MAASSSEPLNKVKSIDHNLNCLPLPSAPDCPFCLPRSSFYRLSVCLSVFSGDHHKIVSSPHSAYNMDDGLGFAGYRMEDMRLPPKP